MVTNICVAQSDELAPLVAELKVEERNQPKAQIALLESFSNRVEELPLALQQRYFKKLSLLYIDLSKYRETLYAANKGVELYANKTKDSIYSDLLYSRGFAYESLDEYDKAKQDYELGLKHALSIADNDMIAQGYSNLGALAYLTNQYAESLVLLNDALGYAEKSNNEETLGMVNSELSLLHSFIGRADESLKYSEQALSHFLKTNNRASILNEMLNLASSYYESKQVEKSTQQFNDLVERSKSFGNAQYIYYAYMGLVRIFEGQENFEAAYEYLQKIDGVIPQLQHGRHILNFYRNKAKLLNKMERYAEALDVLAIADSKIAEYEEEYANYHDIYFDNERANANFGLGNYREAVNNKKKFISTYVEYQREIWEQNTEELRIKLATEKMEANNALLEKEKALSRSNLMVVEHENKVLQLQLIIACVLILLVCYFLYIQIIAQMKLRYLTHTDELTGLDNRERLNYHGNRLIKQAIKKGKPLCAFVMDIDHFKAINDTYGHQAGDTVIRAVASIGKEVLRKTDVFARVGGEEYVAILSNSSLKSSVEVAERLRKTLAERPIDIGGESIKTTISIGVSELNVQKSYIERVSFENLIKMADSALYQAKAQGRNKVVTC